MPNDLPSSALDFSSSVLHQTNIRRGRSDLCCSKLKAKVGSLLQDCRRLESSHLPSVGCHQNWGHADRHIRGSRSPWLYETCSSLTHYSATPFWPLTLTSPKYMGQLRDLIACLLTVVGVSFRSLFLSVSLPSAVSGEYVPWHLSIFHINPVLTSWDSSSPNCKLIFLCLHFHRYDWPLHLLL